MATLLGIALLSGLLLGSCWGLIAAVYYAYKLRVVAEENEKRRTRTRLRKWVWVGGISALLLSSWTLAGYFG